MSISISIWGTCSSRDIIGMGHKFDRGGFAELRTDCYVESVNPLAALTKRVALKEFRADDPRYNDALRGMVNFHKRMLQIQVNKEALARIGAVHSDWFLLDCGALRYDLCVYEVRLDNAHFELSYDECCYGPQKRMLRKAGVMPEPDRTIRLKDVPDEDFEAYMEKFTERILGMYDEERIILNELRQAAFYLNSERAGALDPAFVSGRGKNIDRGFAFLRDRLPKAHVIEFPRGVLADVDHPWGGGNGNSLHFVPEYYDYGYEALNLIVAGGCTREEERARLRDLRMRYEGIIREKYEPIFAAMIRDACDSYYANTFPVARIDLKNSGAASNKVDILNLSDKTAAVSAPNWFRDGNGTGRVVESSAGRLELSLRCEGSGELQIALKGKDLQGAHGERVARWVEYTSFAIDGERVFNDVVSAWHDRPYEKKLQIKDGQLVKISLSWRAQGQRSPSVAANKRTARVDLKNVGAESNRLDVLDVSDPFARVVSPAWFCDASGAGRVVMSDAGSLSFRLRCGGNGELQLRLRGQDVRGSDGKRVPVWIDYTTLVVDGEPLLSEPVAVWHDKPFVVKRSVKDGQIISVSLSWHSHDEAGIDAARKQAAFARERLDASLAEVTALRAENDRLRSRAGNAETERAARVAVEHEVKVLRLSNNKLTARVDLKNVGADGNSLEVFDVSDPSASVESPAWFRDAAGAGRVVKSNAGSLSFRLRCGGNGELQLRLRGQDVKGVDGKRVPVWIDYTSLVVDGISVLSRTKAVWHDKPFRYRMPVKDGQIVSVSLSWHSHDEVQALRSSITRKAGRAVTWLPRKIKALFR